MAMCFFFAGLTFIKAETNATDEVGLSVLPGAKVYLDGGLEDTGIKFDMQISEEGYTSLCEQASAGDATSGAVHLGIQIGRVDANGEFNPLASYTVKTSDTLTTGENAGYKEYSFSIMYNLGRIFEAKYGTEVGYIAQDPGNDEENEEKKAIYDEQQDYINRMYLDELAVRPWYKVVPAVLEEGEQAPAPVYGNVGEARSMLHVAMAEIYASKLPGYNNMNTDTLAQFEDKYLKKLNENAGEVDVYANGLISGVIADGITSFTIGDSGKVVARKGGKIDAAALSGLEDSDTFTLYGYTNDRQVYQYNATYKGEFSTDGELEGEIILAKDNKVFQNNEKLENVETIYYDGKYVSTGKGIDASILTADKLGTSVDVIIKVGDSFYSANALYVTRAFENTKESRQEMRDIFSACSRVSVTAEGAKVETVTGYYVLVDNLTFENGYLPTEEDNGAGYDEKGTDNEMFANNGATYANTFAATLDGRGFALNDIHILTDDDGTMFGLAGDGATIKNVAFNGFKVYERKAGSVEGEFYYVERQDNFSKLFYAPSSKENEITFENVYIYDSFEESNSINYGYFSLVFFDFAADDTDKNTVAKMSFNNVIIDNVGGPVLLGVKGLTTVPADFTIENTYIATAGAVSRGASTLTASENGANFNKVSAVSGISDTQAFIDSGYWMTDTYGVLAWKSTYNDAYIVDSEGDVVSTLSFTEAGEEYSVVVYDDGKKVDASEITLETNSELVSISGNVITIGNGEGTVDVTAYYKGVKVATYTINVDTRAAEPYTEEILLSKLNGQFYFNKGTDAASWVIKGVNYGNNSIYNNGVVDASGIAVTDGTEGNESRTLTVITSEGKYEATNVKVYDGVFGNTVADREALVSTFSGVANTATTGYYVLADNIFFDNDNTNEHFASAANTSFEGTFDGRGYSLNNVYLLAQGSTSYSSAIFGRYAGTCTLKNFAINGVTTTKNYSGLFFFWSKSEATVTIENVYVYKYYEKTVNTEAIFVCNSNTNGLGTWNMNNVVVEVEYPEEQTTRNHKFFNYNGDTTIGGTVSNVYYLTNGTINRLGTYNTEDAVVAYGGEGYSTIQDARKAIPTNNHDLSSFSFDYWVIGADGAPVFKSIADGAVMYNAEDELVNFAYSTTAGETFTVKAFENGVEVTEGVSVEILNDQVVSYDAETGKITVLDDQFGTAFVTVKVGENVVSTISIRVQNKMVSLEKVILSKYNGKLYFNDSSEKVEMANVKDVTYDGESIFDATSLEVDTTFALDTEIGSTTYELALETVEGAKYKLVNVSVYTDVFEDTAESRTRMATTFGCESSGSKVDTLTGYYALAEDLNFVCEKVDGGTTYALDETFGGTYQYGVQTFDATFDGRGHTLNDVVMDCPSSGSYAAVMFGRYQGPNAVLKNFAIKGVMFLNNAKTTKANYNFQTKVGGLFFYAPTTAISITDEGGNVISNDNNKSEISNIYISLSAAPGKNPSTTDTTSCLGLFDCFWVGNAQANGDSLGFKTWENVILDYTITGNYTFKACALASRRSSMPAEPETGLSMNGVYLVLNGKPCFGNDTIPEAYTGIKFYTAKDLMEADANDYSSFASSGYWTVTEGEVPVWGVAK